MEILKNYPHCTKEREKKKNMVDRMKGTNKCLLGGQKRTWEEYGSSWIRTCQFPAQGVSPITSLTPRGNFKVPVKVGHGLAPNYFTLAIFSWLCQAYSPTRLLLRPFFPQSPAYLTSLLHSDERPLLTPQFNVVPHPPTLPALLCFLAWASQVAQR